MDTIRYPLLSRARSEAAQFRNWYRGLVRADQQAGGGTPLVVVLLLTSPLRAARKAFGAVRKYGRRARQASGVSLATQFGRFWWLNMRHGITPDSFYRYQLYRDDRWPIAGEYLQTPESIRINRVLGAHSFRTQVEILGDKRAFEAWCGEHDIPTVPVLAEFDGGRMTRDDTGGTGLPRADLFSKSAANYGGKEARRWRHVGGGRYESGCREYTGDELLTELAAQSKDGPVILQERQRNHPTLAAIAPSALGTIRIVTLRPPGEPARLLLAVYRLAVGGGVTDNFTQGGIVSGVDGGTGELGPAVRPDAQLCLVSYPTHPDTGAAIAGTRLPYWPESVELALRAHGRLGEIPCVGWDVAVLERGPLLLEGNASPGVQLLQMPSGRPLGATEYPRCFNAHLALRFPRPDWALMREYSWWQPTGNIRARSRSSAAVG